MMDLLCFVIGLLTILVGIHVTYLGMNWLISRSNKREHEERVKCGDFDYQSGYPCIEREEDIPEFLKVKTK